MNKTEKAFWRIWDQLAEARPDGMKPAHARLFFNAGHAAGTAKPPRPKAAPRSKK